MQCELLISIVSEPIVPNNTYSIYEYQELTSDDTNYERIPDSGHLIPCDETGGIRVRSTLGDYRCICRSNYVGEICEVSMPIPRVYQFHRPTEAMEKGTVGATSTLPLTGFRAMHSINSNERSPRKSVWVFESLHYMGLITTV